MIRMEPSLDRSQVPFLRQGMGKKKGKPNIAPLQPPTLATFRSWGDSAGAGRAGLLAAKIDKKVRCEFSKVSISSFTAAV